MVFRTFIAVGVCSLVICACNENPNKVQAQSGSTSNALQAQFVLGTKHVLGKGVPKDLGKGLRLITEAAQAGNAAAQFALATITAGGMSMPKNEDLAVDWLERSAKQGYAPSQTGLGITLWARAKTLDLWEAARRWLIQAAEQGDPYAQYRLALTYIAGVDGNMWRFNESLKWFNKSAEQGFVPAQVGRWIHVSSATVHGRKPLPEFYS